MIPNRRRGGIDALAQFIPGQHRQGVRGLNDGDHALDRGHQQSAAHRNGRGDVLAGRADAFAEQLAARRRLEAGQQPAVAVLVELGNRRSPGRCCVQVVISTSAERRAAGKQQAAAGEELEPVVERARCRGIDHGQCAIADDVTGGKPAPFRGTGHLRCVKDQSGAGPAAKEGGRRYTRFMGRTADCGGQSVAWRSGLCQTASVLPDERTSPEQFEVFRRMTPERRLALGESLYWSARELKASWLRAQHADWSEADIAREITRIFLHART